MSLLNSIYGFRLPLSPPEENIYCGYGHQQHAGSRISPCTGTSGGGQLIHCGISDLQANCMTAILRFKTHHTVAFGLAVQFDIAVCSIHLQRKFHRFPQQGISLRRFRLDNGVAARQQIINMQSAVISYA